MFNEQATGPVIRSRTQAMIRIGGEQGREAALSCFQAGSRARGLSCCAVERGRGSLMSCRVRLVNDVTDSTTTVETQRDRCEVFLGLAQIVRHVNRRKDETIKASLHMTPDLVILHWHCQLYWGKSFAAATRDIGEPIRRAEAIIWGHREGQPSSVKHGGDAS